MAGCGERERLRGRRPRRGRELEVVCRPPRCHAVSRRATRVNQRRQTTDLDVGTDQASVAFQSFLTPTVGLAAATPRRAPAPTRLRPTPARRVPASRCRRATFRRARVRRLRLHPRRAARRHRMLAQLPPAASRCRPRMARSTSPPSSCRPSSPAAWSPSCSPLALTDSRRVSKGMASDAHSLLHASAALAAASSTRDHTDRSSNSTAVRTPACYSKLNIHTFKHTFNHHYVEISTAMRARAVRGTGRLLDCSTCASPEAREIPTEYRRLTRNTNGIPSTLEEYQRIRVSPMFNSFVWVIYLH